MYETNNIGPLLDLFYWAYLRSCAEYEVVKASLGEIDGFRIQYRQQRKEVMGQVIRKGMHGPAIETHIEAYCGENNIEQSEKFIAMTLADLDSLHSCSIIGIGITEAQFNTWDKNQSEFHQSSV